MTPELTTAAYQRSHGRAPRGFGTATSPARSSPSCPERSTMTRFTSSGVTAAEQEAIRQLAEAALVEKLSRAFVVGATSSGRTVVEYTGQPGPAETAWFGLQATMRGAA